MEYKKNILLSVLIVLTLSSYALSTNSDTIVIGSANFCPPHEYINHDGKPTGYSVEFIKQIFSNRQIPYVIKPITADNFYTKILNKEIDILIGISPTIERKKDLVFSEPYLNDSKVFISSKTDRIERLSKLTGKTLAVVVNSCSSDFVKNIKDEYSFKIIFKYSTEEVLKAVNSGECDYGYISYLSAIFIQNKEKYSNIRFSNSLKYSNELSFACRKEDIKLINIINQEIQTLDTQKYKDYLENKWITPTLSYNKNEILNRVFPILSILLFIIVILTIISAILQNKIKKKTNELQEALKQTEEAKALAEESNKLKSIFLSNVSHDLRTPLNSICGFSNLLTDNNITDSEKIEYINIINTNSDLLINLISDLIDITKIEANQMKLIHSDFQLNHLIYNIYQKFNLEKQQKGKTNVQLNYFCPLINSLSIIISDKNRVNQILSNLLSNALKFTENGYISFGYYLIEEENQKFIKFYVKDTGIGIKESDLSMIFGRFSQTQSQYTHLGTGIGLSICEKLSEMLGGKIWVESEYGKGSTFYFTIPYIQPEEEEQILNNQISLQYNWSNKSILLIENHNPNKKFIESLLNPTGINKIAFNSGDEAIEYIKENKNIDLVIIDIELPRTIGLDAIEKMKTINPLIPIIALSPHASMEHTETIRNSNCDDFIKKPQKEDDFYNILNIWLNKS